MTVPTEGVVVQDLKKYFLDRKRGLVKAVDGVSFEARPGEIFALLGPNGAGKTTCLRVIATVLKPTAGQVFVQGWNVTQHPDQVRRVLGFHPGDAGVYHRLTPYEMVTVFAELAGHDRREAQKKAWEIFDQLGLTEVAKTPMGKLSTGQRQKSAIARIMVVDPPVWVLDEPALGLDVPTTQEVEQAILDAKQRGRTVILSTHTMEQAEYLADRIAVMDRGKIQAMGTMEDLRRSTHKTRLREIFLSLIKLEAPAP